MLVQSLAENSQIAKVANVSCGAYHTVINTLSGDVFSWGQASYGAVGIATTAGNLYEPQQVLFEENAVSSSIVSISAGTKHTLFLDGFGKVYSCGSNESCQLGLASSRPFE